MESPKLSTMYNKRNTMLNIHNRGKYVLSSSDKSSPRHCSTALKSDAVMYPRLCLSNTCNRTERIATEIFIHFSFYYYYYYTIANIIECVRYSNEYLISFLNSFDSQFSPKHFQKIIFQSRGD